MAGKRHIAQSLSDLVAAEGSLDAGQAQSLMRQLADQLAALHAVGRLHRAIDARAIVLDDQLRITLVDPPEWTSGDAVEEMTLPPELHGQAVPPLPANIEGAGSALRAAGIQLDPRRIDLYQLGCLACELLSSGTPQDYLFSPKAMLKVPAPWRRLVDRLLGYNPAERITNCGELAAELGRLASASQASAADNTPPLGTGIDSLTATPREPHPAAAARPSTAMAPLPFKRLGHYEVVARLGSGGMGDVYRGYEPALDRTVALKVLPPELARQTDFVHRFIDEAKAAARLVHPNIVQIYFIGEDQGHQFFAMQFVAGETLAAKMAREGPLPLDAALAVIEQVLAGLALAHSHGMIHRDIKPGNILLETKHDRALLADFGLVKSLESSVQMTATGMVMGTVDYISPEQGRGKPVDARSDLYSIGVLLYQMLSGRLPFVADSATAMIFQHAYETPRPLDDVAQGIPGGVSAVVHRLLAKDPADRYQSAVALLGDVRALRAAPDFRPSVLPSRPAAGSATDKSVIITAPDFEFADEERRLTTALVPLPRVRWQDRLRVFFHLHAPEVLQNLQNTQQQVEGALAVYQSRRDKLAQLAHEARAVERELAAANQATLLAEQQEQTADIELRLAKVDATLQKLRSQQALLRARLRTAEAGEQIAGGTPPSHVNWSLVHMLLSVSAVLAGFSLLLFGAAWLSNQFSRVPTLAPPTRIEPNKFVAPTSSLLHLLTSPDWEWTPPQNAGPVVNSEAHDGGPFITSDGLTLLFHSMRPGEGRNDLWMSRRSTVADEWRPPQSLGPEINGSSWDESPSLTADGLILVFDSERPGGAGARDIYTASRARADLAWGKVVSLGANINGPAKDFAAFISPDGLTLLFSSDREGGAGGSDLFISRRDSRDDPWDQAISLGSPVNSPSDESGPSLSADGRVLLFSSNRSGGNGQSDFWMAMRSGGSGPFGAPIHLGPMLNTAVIDANARLSPDGRTVWFASTRPGGEGGYDIWNSRRVRKTGEPATLAPSDLKPVEGWQWSAPRNAGPIVNSGDRDEGPFVSADGLNLLFVSQRPGGQGNGDIWMATRKTTDAPWEKPVNLGPNVNSGAWEGRPSMTADKLTLVFDSYREGGYGDSDLYTSMRPSESESWSKAANIERPINTQHGQWAAQISPSGLFLMYSTTRPGGPGYVDLWVAMRGSMSDPWRSSSFGRRVNTPDAEWSPAMSADGLGLLFHSSRPGGFGGDDIWISARTSTSDPFGTPANLGPAINSEYNESNASLSLDGQWLWFNSDRPGGEGATDLWIAERIGAEAD